MNDGCVVLDTVVKRYGRVHAIDGIDLALRFGQCVALIGHNGAGKTTLLKLMLGLVRPTTGKVTILGMDPAGRGAAMMRRRIGYLPESLSLYPGLTGAETLAFYARLKREPVASCAGLLRRVGIADVAHRRVATYSKGMRQRLGLAQALLGAPKVLLLDEPTTGLDPPLRQSFYEIISEMRAAGTAILISSHALAELQDRVDRVVIVNRGRKIAEGTVSELRRKAQHPVRIRLTLADERGAALLASAGLGADWRRISPSVVETACAESEKVKFIGMLASLPVTDVDILSPSLDDTYAHFLQSEPG